MYGDGRVSPKKFLRRAGGSTMLELPLMLWILFALLFVPMIALSAITLRGAIMDCIVRDAAHAAAKARTFSVNTAEGRSARQIAEETVADGVSHFPGLSPGTVTTSIVATDINTGEVTRSSSALTLVDSSRTMYQIEVTSTVSMQPLIPGNAAIFGDIPGFTAPATVTYSARELFENPQGLKR